MAAALPTLPGDVLERIVALADIGTKTLLHDTGALAGALSAPARAALEADVMAHARRVHAEGLRRWLACLCYHVWEDGTLVRGRASNKWVLVPAAPRGPDHQQQQHVLLAADAMYDRYKLGRSKDLKARLRSHGSALGDNLQVVHRFSTPCMTAVETCAKAMLKRYQYRQHKEVYEAGLGMIQDVMAICARACKATEPDGGDTRRAARKRVRALRSVPMELLQRGGGHAPGARTGLFLVLLRD